MKKQTWIISIALAVVILAQLACNLPNPEQPNPVATYNALYTQSAQTLAAMASQVAQTPVPSQGFASPTPLPVNTLTGFYTPTSIPPIKTSTPLSRCDWAAFVTDVTYPDGSMIGRNENFTKIWRLKNIGTCTWTTDYAVVFVSGDSMNAPVAMALTGNVNPGQTVDIQEKLTSPSKDGHFRADFKLRNAAGLLFGVGDAATTTFWVDIKVSGVSYGSYDFAANYCDAQWSNNKKNLPCPGLEGDNDGYVEKLDSPKLENGDPANLPGLLTFPRDVSDGVIRGMYPAINIEDGDHFRSLVQCRYNSAGCNVVFRLDYQIGNGAVKNLGQWNEAYEGQYYAVDIDLTPLAGNAVKFILSVQANGSSAKDFAVWIGPRITSQGVAPATTKTLNLPFMAAESGLVTSGGSVNPLTISSGDSVTNEGVEAFLSFDMSGIPANATIKSVSTRLIGGGQVRGTPFSTLGCMRAYQQNYGTLDAGDFVAPSATGAFASWCSAAELSVDNANNAMVNVLQSVVGAARFRFRLQFRDLLSDNNNTIDDVLIVSPVIVTVTYTVP
jgi:hypothetical protein